jgi:outer membrane protein assembly factor BamD (BamD/ComL family)
LAAYGWKAPWRRQLRVAALAVGLASGGCAWDDWQLFKGPEAPPGAADHMVLRGDQVVPDKAVEDTGAKELAGAQEVFRKSDYVAAEKLFGKIADNKHNSPQVAEEARYYEAECLRLQQRYPKAGDMYNKLLIDFPSGFHREQAVERMFEIANYWLDDTRAEMKLDREKKEGQREFVWPGPVVHWEKTKPLLDEEGRALEKLDQVMLSDLNGRRADEALFLAGSVKFYREDYREADRYFSQLVEMHPNSRFASQAIELAIISKHMSTGGSDYDGRKVAEARKLVDAALRNYPDLAAQKNAFLERQLAGINFQQAEKDFKIAEFYRHTGHPGPAYFYYEIVRRRYPGTPFYDKATARMHELRAKFEKEGKAPPALGGADSMAGPASTNGAPAPGSPTPLEVTPAPRLLPNSAPAGR